MAKNVTYRTKGGAIVTWIPASATPLGDMQAVTTSRWLCAGCDQKEGGESTYISAGETPPTGPEPRDAQQHAEWCAAL